MLARIRQGLTFLFGRYKEEWNKEVKQVLDEREFAVFNEMSEYDRIHSYRLYKLVLEDELLGKEEIYKKLALLHDCGKYHASLYIRVKKVLIGEKTLNNHSEISIYEELVLKYNLLLKKNISDKELEKIKKENSLLEGYYEALKYLTRKMRSRKEVDDFLKRKEYSKECRDCVLEKLEKEGYVNDQKFLEAFLHDQLSLTLNGPFKIKKELEKLGILDYSLLDEISDKVWQERILKIVKKREGIQKKESEKLFKKKLIMYIYTYGYSMSMIESILENYSVEIDENVLLKEKEKYLKKLSSKYDGNALVWQVKRKLYQRGYSSEEIEKIFEKE